MRRSGIIDVFLFVLATWIFYLGIFLLIEKITSPLKQVLESYSQAFTPIVAGILMLAPFIVFWNWYVLDKYYPSRVKKLSKQEASQSPQQSA